MSRAATFLSTEGYVRWMKSSGNISEYTKLTPQPVMVRYSRQSEIDTRLRTQMSGNDGYPIYRFRVVVENPDGKWERQFCKDIYHAGDDGYGANDPLPGNYSNEWTWEDEDTDEVGVLLQQQVAAAYQRIEAAESRIDVLERRQVDEFAALRKALAEFPSDDDPSFEETPTKIKEAIRTLRAALEGKT